MQYYTVGTPLPPYLPYPKFLLDYPLNETARLVYALILSRIYMSQQNGWTDDEGRIWCRYTLADLMKDTGKGRTTVVTALSDLETNQLLSRCRSGAGGANKLYLRLPENRTSECRKTELQTAGKPAPNKYKNKYINNHKSNQPNYAYKGDSL